MRIFATACAALTAITTGGAGAAVGIGPDFEPGATPGHVVGLRYCTRIDSITPGDNVVILFGGMKFYNPGYPQVHTIEVNVYNYWVAYQDTGSVPWPPERNGITHRNQGALWVSVADYNKEGFVGLRQRNQATFRLFPRMNSGIDNIPGLTKIETISQQDMLGKDICIKVTKGEVEQFSSPQPGWGGRYRLVHNSQVAAEQLPAGTYQKWNIRAKWDGVEYAWEAAFPANQSQYFAPHQIIHFVTEFFELKSKIRVYVWNPQVLREGETEWTGLTKWKRHYQAGPDPFGPRVVTVNGRAMIELSNDQGPDRYLTKEARFDLPMNTMVP